MDDGSSDDSSTHFDCDSDTSHTRKRKHAETPSGDVPPSLHNLLKRPYVNVKAIRKMLAKGADLEEKNGKLETPLHSAVLLYRTDIVECMLEMGADVFALAPGGNTPLHLCASTGVVDMSALMLMNGADCNAQNERGETPTHIAAQHAGAAFLRNFLDFGAITSIKDTKGNTVLHRAADRYIAHRRDDDGYDDPVWQARYKRYVVRLLLQYEGDWSKLDALEATNNNGHTAMNIADHYTHDNTVGNELEAALIPAREEARLHSIRAQTAFAMGHHARLGENSIVNHLDPDTLKMVLSFM